MKLLIENRISILIASIILFATNVFGQTRLQYVEFNTQRTIQRLFVI